MAQVEINDKPMKIELRSDRTKKIIYSRLFLIEMKRA